MGVLVVRNTFLDVMKDSLDPRRSSSCPARIRSESPPATHIKFAHFPQRVARFSIFVAHGTQENVETKLFPMVELPYNTFVVDHIASSMGVTMEKFLQLYQIILPTAARQVRPEFVLANTLNGLCLSIVSNKLRDDYAKRDSAEACPWHWVQDTTGDWLAVWQHPWETQSKHCGNTKMMSRL